MYVLPSIYAPPPKSADIAVAYKKYLYYLIHISLHKPPNSSKPLISSLLRPPYSFTFDIKTTVTTCLETTL